MRTAPPKLEPTLCHGLVEAAAASLRAQAEASGVKLVVARNTEDIVARTDRRALGTLVRTLLGHAIERAPNGAVQVSVLERAIDGRPAVEISITEIAAAGAAASARHEPAVALELGHSQELAAALGGEVSIHCKAGEGSTYVLQIPRA